MRLLQVREQNLLFQTEVVQGGGGEVGDGRTGPVPVAGGGTVLDPRQTLVAGAVVVGEIGRDGI